MKYHALLLLLFCTLYSYGENDSSWRFNQLGIDIQHRVSPSIELNAQQLEDFSGNPQALDNFQLRSQHSSTANLRFYIHGAIAKKKHQFLLGAGYGYDYNYSAFASQERAEPIDTFENRLGQLIIKDSGTRTSYAYNFYSENLHFKLAYRYTYSNSKPLRFFVGGGLEWIQPIYSESDWSNSESTISRERSAQDSFFNFFSIDSFGQSSIQPINYKLNPQLRFFGLTGLEYYPFHKYGNWGRLGIFAQFEASGIWSSDQLFNPETFLHFQYGLGLSYQF